MAGKPPKQKWEKELWQWVYSTLPEKINAEHVTTAYGLNKAACPRGKCRRNCSTNPNCLLKLGEEDWLETFDKEDWYGLEDPSGELREEGSCIGLKNLGATCYINTFLQVWYHTQSIREAIYKWRPMDCKWGHDHNGDIDWKQFEDKDLEPSCVCGHLQLLFALLQFSERSYIDPSAFVTSLGLDAAQQQDAQEFGKLFMSLLEEKFKQQNNQEIARIIQDQFGGQYTYVTRCLQCGNCSRTPARFYELDLSIKTHRSLDGCLGEFLKEEKLEKANQYHCDVCQMKCDAVRQIQLNSIPPILNIQLLRFVYCMQTGNKQKLNTLINFPEVLDLTLLVTEKGPHHSLIYDLRAVLIHRGPSAHSGHYVAHIYDKSVSAWYKFNDEEVQQIKGKTLKLGIEEDPLVDPNVKAGKTKVNKGCHSSKNAYMLVYHRREEADLPKPTPSTWQSLPGYLCELVSRDNHQLKDWVGELNRMRNLNVEKGLARHNQIQELYGMLPAKEDLNYDLIQTFWIREWLDYRTKPSEIPTVNNKELLCRHGNMDPGKIHLAKRISTRASQRIYDNFGGGPQVKSSALCRHCIKSRCISMRIHAQLTEDSKFITQALKSKNIETGFWVGKRSAVRWRRLAQKDIEETNPSEESTNQNGESEDKSNGDGNENGCDTSMDKLSESTDSDLEQMTFNSDLLCHHGNMCIADSQRRIVSPEVWTRFCQYFPNAPTFKTTKSPCAVCQREDLERQDRLAISAAMAESLRESLPTLLSIKQRPNIRSKDWTELMIVPHMFISDLKSFMKSPSSCKSPEAICNSLFLCEHEGLLIEPWSPESLINSHHFLLWPSEWRVLSESFQTDTAIRLIREDNEIQTKPAICKGCLNAQRDSLRNIQYDYNGVKLYIRKISDNNAVTGNRDTYKQEEGDPDYFEITAPKKPKMSSNSDNGPLLDLMQRRSSRHRKVRGEKEVVVSSTNTLKELKIKVMHAFSVPPFDQTLLFNGHVLYPDDATLAALQIQPESIICLKVDTAIYDDPIAMQDIINSETISQTREEGFKGTGLLSV